MVTNRDSKSFEPRQKIPNIAQTTGNVDYFDPHVQIFMNDGPNPPTGDAQLLSY